MSLFSCFKSPPRIKFTSSVSGMEEIMPIIPAKELQHVWVKRALNEYAAIRKQPDFGTRPSTHTARCPGIFSLMRHGWVLRAWQDFVIETNGDLQNFQWRTAVDQSKLADTGAYVQSHTREQLRGYMDSWPENTLEAVIKISSGWFCEVPKGYYLMEMPVAYSGETRFTTLHGYFSNDYGPAPLNPQLMWHVPAGTTLIKAGTPLAQYVLVPKQQHELEVLGKAELPKENLLMLMLAHRFVKNFHEIKKFYRREK